MSDSNAPNYGSIAFIVSAALAVGTVFAFVAVYFGGSKASAISTVKGLDLQWLYLALVVLGRTIQVLNFVPTSYKNGLKGNIRSNPFFFETVVEDGKKPTMVLFQESGSNGMYNRSNRSVHHMIENFGGFVASIGPVGYLFPKQTFVLVTMFCLGRILHQKGYATGYGKHAVGFALATVSTVTMEGLALLAFLKAENVIA